MTLDPFAAFIAARLDEEERDALESKNAPRDAVRYLDADRWTEALSWQADEDLVQRRVRAMRAILADHPREPWFAEPPADRPELALRASCARCHNLIPDAREDEDRCTSPDWPCLTVRALGAIWDDHPDYRQEWALAAT